MLCTVQAVQACSPSPNALHAIMLHLTWPSTKVNGVLSATSAHCSSSLSGLTYIHTCSTQQHPLPHASQPCRPASHLCIPSWHGMAWHVRHKLKATGAAQSAPSPPTDRWAMPACLRAHASAVGAVCLSPPPKAHTHTRHLPTLTTPPSPFMAKPCAAMADAKSSIGHACTDAPLLLLLVLLAGASMPAAPLRYSARAVWFRRRPCASTLQVGSQAAKPATLRQTL